MISEVTGSENLIQIKEVLRVTIQSYIKSQIWLLGNTRHEGQRVDLFKTFFFFLCLPACMSARWSVQHLPRALT